MIGTGEAGVNLAKEGNHQRIQKFKLTSGATISGLPRGAITTIGKADHLVDQAPWGCSEKEPHQGQTLEGLSMRITLARRYAALIACAGLGLATPALAQDKTVKIGVLNDMSSLYADIGGANSVTAAKMAVEDSGLRKKGWTIDVLSGDHQNKPDVGVNLARQWNDNGKVNAIADNAD